MRLPKFAVHVLHANRRCRFCVADARKEGYEKGDAAGYLRGVAETRRYHEQREAMWAAGINPDEFMERFRERAA